MALSQLDQGGVCCLIIVFAAVVSAVAGASGGSGAASRSSGRFGAQVSELVRLDRASRVG